MEGRLLKVSARAFVLLCLRAMCFGRGFPIVTTPTVRFVEREMWNTLAEGKGLINC